MLTLPLTLPPAASIFAVASSRESVGSVPVSTKVFPARALLAACGPGGLTAGGEPFDVDLSTLAVDSIKYVFRKEDMLAFGVGLVNLRLGGTPVPTIKRINDGPAFIVLYLPSQHILERTFAPGEPTPAASAPIPALLARSSRLVFAVPSSVTSISNKLPDILAEEGFLYHADYLHDDQPTPINVTRGKLVSIPYGGEINDSVLTSRNRPWELDTLFDMVRDAFDRLYAEGAQSGTVLCLALHPWCSGYPYRIRHLERILDYVMSHEGVWQASGDEIAEHYIARHYDEALARIAAREASLAQRAVARGR